MRLLITTGMALLLTSCGADTTASLTPYDLDDPKLIDEGARYYADSWGDRTTNFVKDNDDGYVMGKNHVGKKANETRQYAYERGVEEMRHGSQGSTGATGSTGANGATGEQGAAGSQGPVGETGESGRDGDVGDRGDQGPTGAAGADGERGPAGEPGDDFDGDERLTDVEERLETLESIVAAQGVLIDDLSTALAEGDSELADAISDLQDELDRVKRKLRQLDRRTQRQIRMLMWRFILNQRPTYDIDVNYYSDDDTFIYEDNDTTVDVDIDNSRTKTVYRIHDILVALMNCGGFADCEIDDIELDD